MFLISDWKLAQQEYQGALKDEANRSNALAWTRFGYCNQILGNYQEAINSYKLALENKPNTQLVPLVHSRIAKIYALKNESDKAFAELKVALATGYTNLYELDTANEFTVIRKDNRYKDVVARATDNAFPCKKDSVSRAFDFWVGEWDAFVTGTNNLAGKSVIQKASGDCMILENWTSASTPFDGKSINFVDPGTGKWEQVWVGSNGRGDHVSRFYDGEYRDSVMQFRFEGKNPNGQKYIGRFRFFNQGPNQVRQWSETSIDEGRSWTTDYDFTYKRKK